MRLHAVCILAIFIFVSRAACIQHVTQLNCTSFVLLALLFECCVFMRVPTCKAVALPHELLEMRGVRTISGFLIFLLDCKCCVLDVGTRVLPRIAVTSCFAASALGLG